MKISDTFEHLNEKEISGALFRGAVAAAVINAQSEYRLTDEQAASELGLSRKKYERIKSAKS